MTWDTLDGRQPDEPRYITYNQMHQHADVDGSIVTHQHISIYEPENLHRHPVAFTVAHPTPDRLAEAWFPITLETFEDELHATVEYVMSPKVVPLTLRERIVGRRVWTSSTGFKLDVDVTWRTWLGGLLSRL